MQAGLKKLGDYTGRVRGKVDDGRAIDDGDSGARAMSKGSFQISLSARGSERANPQV